MKKIILLCMIFISLHCAFATDLESVCLNLSKHPNMTGNFKQIKTIKAINRNLKSFGTYIFCDEGIMWKTEKPFPSSMIVGLYGVKQIKSDGTENFIDASQNQIFLSISTTLKSLFSGNFVEMQNQFNVSFNSEKVENTNNEKWNAYLVPKDKTVSKIIKSIEVSGVSGLDFAEMNKIIMTEASDDSITYTLTEQKILQELTQDEKKLFTKQ